MRYERFLEFKSPSSLTQRFARPEPITEMEAIKSLYPCKSFLRPEYYIFNLKNFLLSRKYLLVIY